MTNIQGFGLHFANNLGKNRANRRNRDIRSWYNLVRQGGTRDTVWMQCDWVA